MSISTVATRHNDSPMNDNMKSPCAGGPVPRWSFTSVRKLKPVAAYDAAVTPGQGGTYLRGYMPLRLPSGGS
jgi:hypothetical protein